MSEVPVYKPTPLNSLKDICRYFTVGKERVKEWIKLGAPIGAEPHGKSVTYFADAAKLQLWRETAFPAREAAFYDEDEGEI